jgi:hypothetical protein
LEEFKEFKEFKEEEPGARIQELGGRRVRERARLEGSQTSPRRRLPEATSSRPL